MHTFQIGDKVRVVRVPPYLYDNADPIKQETSEFFEKCLGKVFPIRDFDERGQLELWTTQRGSPARGLSRRMHWIWIEPEYVELMPVRNTKTLNHSR